MTLALIGSPLKNNAGPGYNVPSANPDAYPIRKITN